MPYRAVTLPANGAGGGGVKEVVVDAVPKEIDMKRWLAGAAVVLMLVMPGVAAAGPSSDAALALGAFAVFNQIVSGTGVFGGGRTVVVERPVVYAPPPPVVYAPPPAVVYAPPPVVYAPPPPPAVVYAPPRPVSVYPAPPPVVVYPKRVYAAPAFCPPGLAKQGRCHEYWHRHGPRY
jgi:hypothetical protein